MVNTVLEISWKQKLISSCQKLVAYSEIGSKIKVEKPCSTFVICLSFLATDIPVILSHLVLSFLVSTMLSAERPLLRLIRSQYPDGAGLRPARPDGPNPFEVALGVTHGPTGMLSYQNRTALFVFFGEYTILLQPLYGRLPLTAHFYMRGGGGGRGSGFEKVIRNAHTLYKALSFPAISRWIAGESDCQGPVKRGLTVSPPPPSTY